MTGNFSEALRDLLAESGLSQVDLARRLRVSRQAVSAWMTAGTIPSWENVLRLEDELAVEPRGSLMKLAGYSTNGDAGEPTIESLIRADPCFDPEDKRVLLRMIRVLRERHPEPE